MKKGLKIPALIRRVKQGLIRLWESADEVARNKAVTSIEAELEELEYIFALLVQGSFVGMPSPPVQISMDLLPHMEADLTLLLERMNTSNEPISRLFSVFDVS
ncbi:MAG: hypothetical protein OQK71_06710 [Desulfobacter sp.]|jgi:hypothetical protein|uniref:hypothetical protein n=1 Tax=uncultured Desulfobacter sp. TaxID=240139 RepID=UPI0029C70274|nr:hypothetical protein [uncultured Desulfobacter sp.]MCW8800598.1 hypothetical protein [Desulfobacter sp.]